jgi:hypothetical protein
VQFSPGFRDQLGSFARVGFKYYEAWGKLTQFVRSFGLRAISQEAWGGYTYDSNGRLLDYTVSPGFGFKWLQGSGIGFSPVFQRTTFLGRPFHTTEMIVKTGMQISKGLFIESKTRWGEEIIYDFENPRMGRGFYTGVTPYIRPLPSILVQPSYTYFRTVEDVGGREVANANLLSVSAQYQYSPRLGMRAYTQFSDQASNLIENPFERRDAYVHSSFLVGYELVSTSFLYVGVNDERRRFQVPVVQNGGYVQTGLRVFLKATYLVRM